MATGKKINPFMEKSPVLKAMTAVLTHRGLGFDMKRLWSSLLAIIGAAMQIMKTQSGCECNQ